MYTSMLSPSFASQKLIISGSGNPTVAHPVPPSSSASYIGNLHSLVNGIDSMSSSSSATLFISISVFRKKAWSASTQLGRKFILGSPYLALSLEIKLGPNTNLLANDIARVDQWPPPVISSWRMVFPRDCHPIHGENRKRLTR
ncbi:hypothetical protein MLD38_015587 [Melastoma candidum]|uniref:Uncharacterized protein n=1 Tax=Melastoma candidum TaxID=119954 RepID=A0ACB9RFV4_9MYRT|nr:hypothetical protein MLD38_015587 [Melastoma candidum]